MKKRELDHKGKWLFVIVAFIVIAILVFNFGMNNYIEPKSTSQESTSAHASELFSCYGDKIVVFSLYESPLLQYASNLWNRSHTPEVVCVSADDLWGQDNWNYNQVRQEIETLIYQGVGPDLLVIDNLGYLYSSLGQFTRNYTQTTKRGLLTTNKG